MGDVNVIQSHMQHLVFGAMGSLRFGPVGPGGMAALPCYYLTFDGANDRITLVGITIAAPYTIVAWTKRAVAGVAHYLLGHQDALSSYYAVRADNTDRLTHNGAAIVTATASAALTWIHRAGVVRNGVVAKLFRDGVDVTAAAGIAAGNTVWDAIGYGNAGNFWNGQLAAIGIAPAELDIAAMWAAGTFHKPLNPATFTVACWNMRNEGGAGTTLDDESAGANDGSFLGAGQPAWGGHMHDGGPAGWSDS